MHQLLDQCLRPSLEDLHRDTPIEAMGESIAVLENHSADTVGRYSSRTKIQTTGRARLLGPASPSRRGEADAPPWSRLRGRPQAMARRTDSPATLDLSLSCPFFNGFGVLPWRTCRIDISCFILMNTALTISFDPLLINKE